MFQTEFLKIGKEKWFLSNEFVEWFVMRYFRRIGNWLNACGYNSLKLEKPHSIKIVLKIVNTSVTV